MMDGDDSGSTAAEALKILGQEWPRIASKLSTASMAGGVWTECLVVIISTEGDTAALCKMFSELTGDPPGVERGTFVLPPDVVRQLAAQDPELATMASEAPADRVLVLVHTNTVRAFMFADRAGGIHQ